MTDEELAESLERHFLAGNVWLTRTQCDEIIRAATTGVPARVSQ